MAKAISSTKSYAFNGFGKESSKETELNYFEIQKGEMLLKMKETVNKTKAGVDVNIENKNRNSAEDNTENIKQSTLNQIVRINILELKFNQRFNEYWIIDDAKMFFKDKDKKEKLSDDELLSKINDGSISTEKGIKKHRILINESEFFRIVKSISPDNCIKDEKRIYPILNDIVEMKVGESCKTYGRLFDDDVEEQDYGIITVNGKRFKRIFCNSSHNRAKKALFIAEELYDKVMEISLCGINPHNEKQKHFPCKWNAYIGMNCTDSQPVSTPNIVVVEDYKQPITDTFDIVSGKIVKDKNGESEYEISTDVQNNQRKTVKINPFDGAGLVDVELARKWQHELKLNYLPSAWQFRAMPGIKGNVYTWDIKKFAKFYHVRKITDCWGRKWDLYDDKIDCIMTESQFKFAKLYNSFDEWKTAFDTDLYGYHRTFNISDINEPYEKIKNHCVLAYQPLQTLNLTDDEIKDICADTVANVKKIHTDVSAFVKWRGLDQAADEEQGKDDEGEHQPSINTNPALAALKYNHSLATDPYIKKVMLEELRKFRCLNHIKISTNGNYQVLIPDLYGLAQWAFKITPTGLLQEKQVYNLFWKNNGAEELDLIRYPHIAREHCLATVANESDQNWDEMVKWYKYQDVGYVTSMKDSFALRLGGADYDNDHIIGCANKTIIEAVRRQEANTIWFDDVTEKGIQGNEKVTADNYIAMAQSDCVGFQNDIGTVVNATSKLWSMITPENTEEQNKKLMDYIKVLSVADSLTIDFVKSGVKADIPKEIKDVLNGIKNPNFFKYRTLNELTSSQSSKSGGKRKPDGKKIKEYTSTNSTMNRIANYMGTQIENVKYQYDVPQFKWETLLQGNYDHKCTKIYKAVEEQLLDLMQDYKPIYRNINGNASNNQKQENKSHNLAQMVLFFYEARNDLLLIQPDINKLINDIIVVMYTTEYFAGNKTKAILWQCFTKEMMLRVQNKKIPDKIYDIEKLEATHQKIEKTKEKGAKQSLKNIFVDDIKVPVSITNMDKKRIDKTLKTYRSKRLYYALLYIWLKINAESEKEELIKIGYNKNKKHQITVKQLCNVSAFNLRCWEDAFESLQHYNLIEYDEDQNTIKVLYQREDGEKIKLPDTCLSMRSWLKQYVPTVVNQEYEFNFDNSKATNKGTYSNKSPVVRIEDKKIFNTVKEAGKAVGIIQASHISEVCAGKRKGHKAGGYHWMYLKEYENRYENQEKKEA